MALATIGTDEVIKIVDSRFEEFLSQPQRIVNLAASIDAALKYKSLLDFMASMTAGVIGTVLIVKCSSPAQCRLGCPMLGIFLGGSFGLQFTSTYSRMTSVLLGAALGYYVGWKNWPKN